MPLSLLLSPSPSQPGFQPRVSSYLSGREKKPVASYWIPRTGLRVHLAACGETEGRRELGGLSQGVWVRRRGCGRRAEPGPRGREAGTLNPAARSPPPTSSPWTPVPTRGSLWTAMTPAARLGWTGTLLGAQHPWFLVLPVPGG